MNDFLSTFREVVMRTICDVRSICKHKKLTEEGHTTIIRYRELNIYRYWRKQTVPNPKFKFYKGKQVKEVIHVSGCISDSASASVNRVFYYIIHIKHMHKLNRIGQEIYK